MKVPSVSNCIKTKVKWTTHKHYYRSQILSDKAATQPRSVTSDDATVNCKTWGEQSWRRFKSKGADNVSDDELPSRRWRRRRLTTKIMQNKKEGKNQLCGSCEKKKSIAKHSRSTPIGRNWNWSFSDSGGWQSGVPCFKIINDVKTRLNHFERFLSRIKKIMFCGRMKFQTKKRQAKNWKTAIRPSCRLKKKCHMRIRCRKM